MSGQLRRIVGLSRNRPIMGRSPRSALADDLPEDSNNWRPVQDPLPAIRTSSNIPASMSVDGRLLSVSEGGNQHKAIAGFWLYPVFQHDRRGDPLVVATVVGNQDGAGRQ